MVTRTLCVLCADWPVTTARRANSELLGEPVAVVDRIDGRMVVVAASAEARDEMVVPGLRQREAEGRCAGLMVVEADPAADARAFEEVARAVEAITPRVVLEEPGVLSFPTRGPSRYFGGDAALAALVIDTLRASAVLDARVGVADGAFAARLAARAADVGSARVVDPGTTPAFLAPWSVRVLASDPESDALADLLVRLGLSTLGAFAALPAPAVLARFGTNGARAHRLACGLDEHAVQPAPPPPDLVETAELDPPATRVDEAAFAAKGLADRLLGRLAALGLGCAQVRVEAETEHGERLARCWRHDEALTPAALVTRVRWQLDAWLLGASSGPRGGGRVSRPPSERDHVVDGFATGGLTMVRLVPEQVVPAEGRQLGFWGGDAAAGDRADRALARLQGLLGHDAVVTAVPCGGRTPAERVRWVPWGDARDARGTGDADLEAAAWPGAVPGPAPARVFAPALPAELLDAHGHAVTVSGRGDASGAPARLMCAALPRGGGTVRAWAGPWLHDVRWWDRVTRRRRALWHVVVSPTEHDELGEHDSDMVTACLVGLESGRATLEAIYD
jgi:protein ImuB